MKPPAFFPITLHPSGWVGLDIAKMTDAEVSEALDQWLTKEYDADTALHDKWEIARLRQAKANRLTKPNGK